MTHDRDSSRGSGRFVQEVAAPAPQPGDRLPAPGRLGLVQAFANSRWDLDHGLEDKFATPASLARWLREQGLLESGPRLDRTNLARALDVREGLRELLFVNNGANVDPALIERLNVALGGAEVTVQFGVEGQSRLLPPRRGLDGALAAIAAIVVVAQADGSWARLKACRGRDCGWVFFDHSRNQSGSWCTMSVCGWRANARAYRARRRQ
jgi:predicted RNA-binding Zn ribbon-like protein